MSLKALGLATKLTRKQYPGQKAIEDGFKSVSDSAVFGLKSKANIERVNTLLTDMNQREKELKSRKEALLNQLTKKIPWNYYEARILNKNLVKEARNLYDSIFEGKIGEDAINSVKTYKPEAKEIPSEVRNVVEALEKRQKELEHTVEHEINPLLNPFADFWTYQKDGPEFHEVFAARPQWNEYINTAADDYAFHFPVNSDPLKREDLRESYRSGIQAKLDEFEENYYSEIGLIEKKKGTKALASGNNAIVPGFKPKMTSEDALNQIRDIASGKLAQDMLDHYEVHYNAANEKALLEEYTYGDNAAIAMRNPFVSGESDPQSKHFGGH